jgi:hypothetical protein
MTRPMMRCRPRLARAADHHLRRRRGRTLARTRRRRARRAALGRPIGRTRSNRLLGARRRAVSRCSPRRGTINALGALRGARLDRRRRTLLDAGFGRPGWLGSRLDSVGARSHRSSLGPRCGRVGTRLGARLGPRLRPGLRTNRGLGARRLRLRFGSGLWTSFRPWLWARFRPSFHSGLGARLGPGLAVRLRPGLGTGLAARLRPGLGTRLNAHRLRTALRARLGRRRLGTFDDRRWHNRFGGTHGDRLGRRRRYRSWCYHRGFLGNAATNDRSWLRRMTRGRCMTIRLRLRRTWPYGLALCAAFVTGFGRLVTGGSAAEDGPRCQPLRLLRLRHGLLLLLE